MAGPAPHSLAPVGPRFVSLPLNLSVGSGRIPGDFGLDPLNFCSTPEKTADYKLKEITHCRLAMFAFSGMVTQAVLTQSPFPYMS